MKKLLLLTCLGLVADVFAETIKPETVIIFNDTDCKANKSPEEDDCKYKFLYSYDKSSIEFVDKELLSSFGINNAQSIEQLKKEIAKYVAEEKKYMQESVTGASSVVETKFLNQRNNLVQYVSHTSSYSAGAAHGMFGEFYYVFDLEAKKRLNLKDILITGKEKNLVKVLEKSLGNYFLTYADNNSPDYKQCLNKKKTNKTTCAVKVFAINPKPFEDLYETANNFYFTDKGMTFDFPPYSVAAFAYGEVGIDIDKKELKGIIKDKYLK